MNKPISVALFDLGNTLMYDTVPWEPFFNRADKALWVVLHKAGVSLNGHDLYGDSETLFNYYYSRHRGSLDEPTTFTILDGLLREHGSILPVPVLRQAMRAMYSVTQSNWFTEIDAIPTLQILGAHGIRLGLVSNAADDENTQYLIDKGGFRPYFDFIISSAALGKRKPHPAIFKEAIDYFKTPPEQLVMIGDTYEADVVGGQQVGMNTIWITRRIRGRLVDPRPAPDAIVSTLAEIPSLIF